MKKLRTKEAINTIKPEDFWADSLIESAVKEYRRTRLERYVIDSKRKYPTKRQIWFRRHENLLMAIGGVVVAGLCVFSYAMFMKGGK